MAQTKGGAQGVGEFLTSLGVIAKSNLKVIKVDVGASLATEDDATREAVERALQFIQPLVYEVKNNTSGEIHAVVDGSQFDAAALQAQIRAIGSVTDPTTYNFGSAVVTLGTGLSVD
jgi:flavin-binding protein dodecin